MAKRYHISRETGRPNICRAQTPQSCTVEPAFNENETPHFSNKIDAQLYIENKLEEENDLIPTKNKQVAQETEKTRNKKDLAEIENAWLSVQKSDEQENNYYFDSPIENINLFFSEKLPDFALVKTIEKIDYINEHLIKKGNNYYRVSSHGGEYSNYSILSYEALNKKFKSQWVTNVDNVSKINDSNIFNSLKELSDEYKNAISFTKEDDGTDTIAFNEYESDVVLEREDGSKIYGFKVPSEGDSSILDTPFPVQVDLELYENDERQNGREMDKGYALYDTRNHKGFVLTYRDSSESGGGDYFFESHNGSIETSKTDPGLQKIYKIQGNGKTLNSEYFEAKN